MVFTFVHFTVQQWLHIVQNREERFQQKNGDLGVTWTSGCFWARVAKRFSDKTPKLGVADSVSI
jgi:hypothetical protein